MKNKEFNLKIALEDKGNCQRQKVKCKKCIIGEILERSKDELCPRGKVYRIAKLVSIFKTTVAK